MTDVQKAEWQKIESEILSAFKGVKLDDGIGYFEADAIDDYLVPSSIKYQEEKAKDEREDWTRLFSIFKDLRFDSSRHSFMDKKGILFYLPFAMTRKEDMVNSVMYFYISEVYKREGYEIGKYTELITLLTPEQKQCIYDFYTFLNRIEHPDFSNESLNYHFDTGEVAMKGFDYMQFIEMEFDLK